MRPSKFDVVREFTPAHRQGDLSAASMINACCLLEEINDLDDDEQWFPDLLEKSEAYPQVTPCFILNPKKIKSYKPNELTNCYYYVSGAAILVRDSNLIIQVELTLGSDFRKAQEHTYTCTVAIGDRDSIRVFRLLIMALGGLATFEHGEEFTSYAMRRIDKMGGLDRHVANAKLASWINRVIDK